jgi:serine/threonine protein kinase
LSAREPGTILDGKYEIVQRLGSGGMGEVYLVRHVHLQELRVVKILRQDLAADPVAQKRFVREARLATQIKHPNVAILYDFSRLPDGSFYMVWEHIQGQDVGDWLRQRGPFPVATAIRLGIQALRGLGAIHTAGIIHRDVSPDNLMIMENHRQQAWLKIIDLGLAKNLAPEDTTSSGSSFEITQVGMFMGKLQYCSPEQAGAASGEVLDRRSDLYSFALVFYEMITGLPPFESESPHGFIFKRLSEEPLPMVGRNPKVAVPAELDRVVRQALERDRDKRMPDAVSFIVALERVEKGLSKVETREVMMPPAGRAGEPRPAAQPRQRSSSELSREERLDLLAQIERAAKRVSESSMDMARAEGAIAAGRLEEARRMVAQIEAAHPRSPGLDQIKERLARTPAATAPAERTAGAPHAAAPSAAPAAIPPLAAAAPSAGKEVPASPPPATSAAPLAPPAPLAAMGAGAPPPPAATRHRRDREEGGVAAGLRDEARRPAAPATPPTGGAGVAGAASEKTADRRERTAEAEKVLRKYLDHKQLPLARLALETLLELAPQHPNRSDYEGWVKLLAEEVEQERRAEVALMAGRAALGRRDFAKVREELQLVRRNDLSGERAAALEAELEETEHGLRQGAEFERRKRRLNELLATRKVAEAEREIEHLAGLGLSKITLDSYRERLQETRLAADQERLAAPIEKRYREMLHGHDWFAAREAANDMERAAPASSRAGVMYAEIERLEAIHQRQQAVEQGVRQIDAFLERGDLASAELAFRILLNLDPENRHRKRLERQLRGASRG